MSTVIVIPKVSCSLGYPCLGASISSYMGNPTTATASISVKDIDGGMLKLSDLISLGAPLQTKALNDIENNKMSISIKAQSSISFTGLINGVQINAGSNGRGIACTINLIHKDVLLSRFNPSVYMQACSEKELGNMRKKVLSIIKEKNLPQIGNCNYVYLMDQDFGLSITDRISSLIQAAASNMTQGLEANSLTNTILNSNKELLGDVKSFLSASSSTSTLKFKPNSNAENIQLNNFIATHLFSSSNFLIAVFKIASYFGMTYGGELTGEKPGKILVPGYNPDSEGQAIKGYVHYVNVATGKGNSFFNNGFPISQYAIPFNVSGLDDGKFDSNVIGSTVYVAYPATPKGNGSILTQENPFNYATIPATELYKVYNRIPAVAAAPKGRNEASIISSTKQASEVFNQRIKSNLQNAMSLAKDLYFQEATRGSSAKVGTYISLDSGIIIGKRTDVNATNGGKLVSGVLQGIDHVANSSSGLFTDIHLDGALLPGVSV